MFIEILLAALAIILICICAQMYMKSTSKDGRTMVKSREMWKKSRPTPWKSDWKEGMVYLYQFPRSSFIPSISPYSLKLETWLRMADIPYENVDIPLGTFSREGSIPFVELNGKELCDSSLIIRDLSRIFGKENMDSDLSLVQKGSARAFEQMIDNSTFWSYAYVRYVEKLQELFSERIFPPVATFGWRKIFLKLGFQQRGMKNKLHYHGIGCHSREDIIKIGLEDIRAVSQCLGTKQFLMGEKATQVDATVFGTLAQMVYLPIETGHPEFIRKECKNLVDYCDRIKGTFWPDWSEACENLSLHTDWKKFK